MAKQHFKIVIAGGGTAGITVAARLAKRLPAGSLALIEPSSTHWYQPLFTLVGGGVASLSEASRPMSTLIPEGVTWIKDSVSLFDPDQNKVCTSRDEITYDYLVVALGIKVIWDGIQGLNDALATEFVGSNYSEKYTEKTWSMIKEFKGGNALFTFPSTPVKCAGAPQKIMYLAEETFRRNNIRSKSNVTFTTAGEKIFAVKKYADSLTKIILEREINVKFKHDLIAIDGKKKIAVYKNLADMSEVELKYDIAHVTPPMGAPDVVKQSKLAAANGFVDVDKHTLRHAHYGNVFSLGDVSSLPTSKTGAAIRKQAPVLVENLLNLVSRLEGETDTKSMKTYDGYTSCPLVTGYGKLILAEFDYDLKPTETFPFDQSKERASMYYLKRYGLPQLYWHVMLRGRG